MRHKFTNFLANFPSCSWSVSIFCCTIFIPLELINTNKRTDKLETLRFLSVTGSFCSLFARFTPSRSRIQRITKTCQTKKSVRRPWSISLGSPASSSWGSVSEWTPQGISVHCLVTKIAFTSPYSICWCFLCHFIHPRHPTPERVKEQHSHKLQISAVTYY